MPLVSVTALLQCESSLTPARKLLEMRRASCRWGWSGWSSGVCFRRSWKEQEGEGGIRHNHNSQLEEQGGSNRKRDREQSH